MFRVIKEPTTVIRVNVCGTERLLEAAADCKSKAHIIIASSSSVYGHSNESHELTEDKDLTYKPEDGGLTGYALSKLTNEIQAQAYHREYGLRVIIPRFFNVVGARQTGTYGFVIPRFIQQAMNGQPLTVFGDGSQIRSFCDVRDAIKALDRLVTIEPKSGNTVCGEVVNVGNNREISALKAHHRSNLCLSTKHTASISTKSPSVNLIWKSWNGLLDSLRNGHWKIQSMTYSRTILPE
jgi:UDP-glucose 4-epimerase